MNGNQKIEFKEISNRDNEIKLIDSQAVDIEKINDEKQ
jgi:hypothetical protein